MRKPTLLQLREGRGSLGEKERSTQRVRRGNGDGMYGRGNLTQHGKPLWVRGGTLNRQPARDRLGPAGVADRLVVPKKPSNAGGGKGPEFKANV